MPTGHNANQRLAFCPDFFLWLAFCPSQLFGWNFVRTISTCFGIFFQILKIIFQITFHKKAKSISTTGSDEGKLSQLLRTLCKEKEVDTMRWLFHLNVSDDAAQELVTEQIKSIVSELQQIKGDSGLRAKLLLGKWAAAWELDTYTPMDCKFLFFWILSKLPKSKDLRIACWDLQTQPRSRWNP